MSVPQGGIFGECSMAAPLSYSTAVENHKLYGARGLSWDDMMMFIEKA